MTRNYGIRSDSGIGPWLYLEHGGFMLHAYWRRFNLPWQHGWHWGYSLRLAGRSVLFGCSPST